MNEAADGRRHLIGWTAAGFAAFFLLSWAWPASRVLFPSNLPPLFVRWRPLVGPELAVPIALGVALWAVLPMIMRLPPAWFLVVLVLFAWTFSETLAMQAGGARKFQSCCLERGYD